MNYLISAYFRVNYTTMNFSKINPLWHGVMFISLLFSSCQKYEHVKIVDTNWNPDLAIPLVYANFSAGNILARSNVDDLIIIDSSERFLALVYKSDLFRINAADYLKLNDFFYVDQISLANLNLSAQGAYNSSEQVKLNRMYKYEHDSGVELKNIQFRTGKLEIRIVTNLRHEIDVNLNFPTITNPTTGLPTSTQFKLNNPNQLPQSSGTVTIDLNNVIADFSLNGTSSNNLAFEADIKTIGSGAPISGNEYFSIEIKLKDIDFESIVGYLGKRTLIQADDSLLVKIFQNASDGYFELVNPSVRFAIENGFGIPVQIDIPYLGTYNTVTKTAYPLTGFPNPIVINAPSSIGQIAKTTLQFDKSNTSNINQIITPTPKYFNFKVQAAANPQGKTGVDNFINRNSSFALITELELPLEGFAYGFQLTDTQRFNFDYPEAALIEELLVRVNINNGFPVDLRIQTAFLDENKKELFRLFQTPENILTAGQVDANGKLSNATRKITDIQLGTQEAELLKKAKYYAVFAETETLQARQARVIKLYEDNFLELRIGARVKAKIEVK